MTLNWNRPRIEGSTLITTVEAHAAGEPLRIVTGGMPELHGGTILERRRYMLENLDHIRRALMWEPRGHMDMYGCVPVPPVTSGAHLGVLFMHNEGYSTMCGHGVIALVTALLETGTITGEGSEVPVDLDTPAGLVRAVAHLGADGRVERVSFLNVPSFVYLHDVVVEAPEIGRVTVDIAYGGAFYAILPAERVGLRVVKEQTQRLVAAGQAIKVAANNALTVRHPLEEEIDSIYGTILTGPPENPAHHSRNICVFANAEVDRSPTGTGVSARLALHHARSEVADGERIVIESILGRESTFGGRVAERTQVGEYPAVVPEVSGTAFITGYSEFVLDPRDGLGRGFLIASAEFQHA